VTRHGVGCSVLSAFISGPTPYKVIYLYNIYIFTQQSNIRQESAVFRSTVTTVAPQDMSWAYRLYLTLLKNSSIGEEAFVVHSHLIPFHLKFIDLDSTPSSCSSR
jgi:hypothetical protein